MSARGIERRHLLAVQALSRHGSYSSAAAALFVTPSTLATNIRELERLVGHLLTERTSVGTKLNVQGEAVAKSAGSALASMDGVLEDGRTAAAPDSGSLLALTTPTIAESVGALLVSNLRRRHRGLRISIRSPRRPVIGDVPYAVAAGEADFGMSEALSRPIDGVVSVPLGVAVIGYAFPSTAPDRPRVVTMRHLERYGLLVVPHFESSSVYPELRARSSAVDSWIRARVAHRDAFADLAVEGVAGFLCDLSSRVEVEQLGLHVAPFRTPFERHFATFARIDDRRPIIGEVLAHSRRLARARGTTRPVHNT